MNGKLISVPVANFLLNKIANQFKALCGCKFTRQGNFNFAVGTAVGTFKRVSGFPKLGRFMRCPCGHITGLLMLKVIIFFTGIFSLTRNIIGMGSGFAFPAGFNAEMIRCHAVFARCKRAPFLNEVKKRLSAP